MGTQEDSEVTRRDPSLEGLRPREQTSERLPSPEGMSALSDREIDNWLLTMERLFGKEFLES